MSALDGLPHELKQALSRPTPSAAEFWAGEFGDSYTKRNRVDWRARIPFWRTILEMTGARSAFELGCNAGWNLSAIQRVDQCVMTYGVDVNQSAVLQANAAGLRVHTDGWKLHPPKYDLAFTAGVLIHIPPADLPETMRRLIDLSSDYVLAVEYAADTETEVEYRGHAGRLWKRPYGRLYMDMGLDLVETGIAEGFDQCTYWLLRKPV